MGGTATWRHRGTQRDSSHATFNGICPSLIELNFNNERFYGYTVQEVVTTVKRPLFPDITVVLVRLDRNTAGTQRHESTMKG